MPAKKKPVSDRPVWFLRDEDRSVEKSYRFDPRTMLKVGVLRQLKATFGPDLGAYMGFMDAFVRLDPEACVCALWVAKQEAGAEVPASPNDLGDFPLGDFIEKFIPAGTPDPTGGDQTPGSPQTSTSSGTGTSDS